MVDFDIAEDGDPQPPETHGDGDHDSTVPSQSDVDSKADDPHGNAAHSSTFAVDGDAQPPEEHGNAAHEYTLQVDGQAVGAGDTINFQTQ